MELNKVKKWGNSKVVRVNEYKYNEDVFILSIKEYNNMIINSDMDLILEIKELVKDMEYKFINNELNSLENRSYILLKKVIKNNLK